MYICENHPNGWKSDVFGFCVALTNESKTLQGLKQTQTDREREGEWEIQKEKQ